MWKVFRIHETKPDTVVCLKCKEEFAWTHRNTSNMRQHINRRHPTASILPINNWLAFGEAETQKIHRWVAYHLIVDMRPFAEVEGEGWKRMMQHLQPRYKPATAKTYAAIASKLYEDVKKDVS